MTIDGDPEAVSEPKLQRPSSALPEILHFLNSTRDPQGFLLFLEGEATKLKTQILGFLEIINVLPLNLQWREGGRREKERERMRGGFS